MSSSTSSPALTRPRAVKAQVRRTQLLVHLTDGRALSVPIGWFPWLAGATVEDRADLRIIENGAGIWWEQLGDGVSVPSLLGLPEGA